MLKWIKVFGVSLLGVFAPIQSLLVTAIVLILGDLVSGIMAAVKRGERITSSGIRRTLSKIFVYEVALCVAFVAETYMVAGVPLVKMVSGMIALTECSSILENLDTINGSSLLKSVIERIGSKNQEDDVRKK